MSRQLTLVRQEAEALVDLLELQDDDTFIHDKSAMEFAAELRVLFGMATRREEALAWQEAHKNDLKIELPMNIRTYKGDFGEVRIAPDLFNGIK